MTEITVCKAEPITKPSEEVGAVFCTHFCDIIQKGTNYDECSEKCHCYIPKKKDPACCKYIGIIYVPGDNVTLKLKEEKK